MLALIVGLGTEPVFPAFEGLKLKKKKIEIWSLNNLSISTV
jgi:hypothetical protein